MVHEYACSIGVDHTVVDAKLKKMSDFVRADDCTLKGDQGSKQLLFSILASVRCTLQNREQFKYIQANQIEENETEKLNDYLNANYGKFVHYAGDEKDTDAKRRKWTEVFSGRATSVKIDGSTVRYGDHVTRMQAINNKRPEVPHCFQIPDW